MGFSSLKWSAGNDRTVLGTAPRFALWAGETTTKLSISCSTQLEWWARLLSAQRIHGSDVGIGAKLKEVRRCHGNEAMVSSIDLFVRSDVCVWSSKLVRLVESVHAQCNTRRIFVLLRLIMSQGTVGGKRLFCRRLTEKLSRRCAIHCILKTALVLFFSSGVGVISPWMITRHRRRLRWANVREATRTSLHCWTECCLMTNTEVRYFAHMCVWRRLSLWCGNDNKTDTRVNK